MAFFLKCLSWFSLAGVRRFGAFVGRLLYHFEPRTRRLIDDNLKQAGLFSEQTALRVGEETGVQALEGLWVWQRDPDEIDALTEITGDVDVLRQCVREDKALVLITPHIGTFEIAPIIASRRILKGTSKVMAIMYKVPHKGFLRKLAGEGRQIPNILPATADLAGLRQMLKAIRAGNWVGILPDQVPGNGQGVWVDFFGKPAYTMTLPLHFARSFGVPVVMAAAKRVPGGWSVSLEKWDRELTDDNEADCRALNAWIEQAVRTCPEQYLWAYNRYKVPSGVKPPCRK